MQPLSQGSLSVFPGGPRLETKPNFCLPSDFYSQLSQDDDADESEDENRYMTQSQDVEIIKLL